MEIRAIAPNEWKYTYSQSMQITGQTGSIGHLRGTGAFESRQLPCSVRQQVPTQYRAIQADDNQIRRGIMKMRCSCQNSK